MNTASAKRDLLESLKEREFRQAFNLENVYATICFQLRALREQRELSQAGLGRAAKMAQERISILEDPNAKTKPTLNTLLRVADGLDVGLEVRFVPFSTVLDRSVHTSTRELEVPSFTDELPILERPVAKVIEAEYIETEPAAVTVTQRQYARVPLSSAKVWAVAAAQAARGTGNVINMNLPQRPAVPHFGDVIPVTQGESVYGTAFGAAG
ncbi:MAG TPA: helix-turn-helix transcriptional regulator [Terriglobales bacterium]